ncbi:hypothetical protein SAMN05444365_10726 [Micromonospora pattaloongensis]|uniref:Uncharacterized protein n=1 Tax=Micromonospora pattaloongensis TaxID=405436 RepID=A0A1H3R3X6_9ACTN|nr:hypothetical protein [Micromonospora pattaloongensis]SDZ20015.1 hypothetical protein SAMN05444365_10726 [Micromonospora pattaloongensis]
MRSLAMDRDSRLFLWQRVREYAVPPSMIESVTARRRVGDWAGACSAARVDVDFNLRSAARLYGREVAARIRSDLRHLAPDLLRWHMPRIAPDGLLRPGLTVSLARYDLAGPNGPMHLVVRTPPAWADAGQRMSLALWTRSGQGPSAHPHPHPDRRFRLDFHRHLWDARRAGELRVRAGLSPHERGWAIDRWADEAAILLDAEGMAAGTVAVRLGGGKRLLLGQSTGTGRRAGEPLVLPDAATWTLPDQELLDAGLVEADRLHPLVAAALGPGPPRAVAPPRPDPHSRLVECRGVRHRIGVVGGVLTPLDHDAAEIRREELLAALTGTPLPCLRVIDEAHRHPECLPDVRARLDHGDVAGALATVEALLGPDALLRAGALREELETAALRRITYGLFRCGLAGVVPFGPRHRQSADRRVHRRHTTSR